MTKQEALEVSLWAKVEATKLQEPKTLFPMEADLLAYWQRERPKMVAALGIPAASNLARVLIDRMLNSETENKAAGMPWTDARERRSRTGCFASRKRRHQPTVSCLWKRSHPARLHDSQRGEDHRRHAEGPLRQVPSRDRSLSQHHRRQPPADHSRTGVDGGLYQSSDDLTHYVD